MGRLARVMTVNLTVLGALLLLAGVFIAILIVTGRTYTPLQAWDNAIWAVVTGALALFGGYCWSRPPSLNGQGGGNG